MQRSSARKRDSCWGSIFKAVVPSPRCGIRIEVEDRACDGTIIGGFGRRHAFAAGIEDEWVLSSSS